MNKYVLIADAGSSKTDWALLSGSPRKVERLNTAGINPMIMKTVDILTILEDVFERLPEDTLVTEIHYFGAGCRGEGSRIMRQLLETVFRCDHVEVDSDMTGAARGLLGKRKGIACILGTGSNSCLYDGHDIIENVPSLGFILGDEGSGSALGKRLLADALKGVMPERLREEFFSEFPVTVDNVIKNVYRQPNPNRYLASFAPFALKHIGEEYMKDLTKAEFGRFFERNVKRYPNHSSLPIVMTGSVAYHFADVIRETAAGMGLDILKIVKSPIEEMINLDPIQ